MKLSAFLLGLTSITAVIVVAISLCDSYCPDTEWGKIIGTITIVLGVGCGLLWSLLKILTAITNKLLGRE